MSNRCNRAPLFRRALWLAVLSVLAYYAPARADDEEKPPLAVSKEEGIRFGLPSGEGSGSRSRVGAWMPVYVDLICGEKPIGQGQYFLVVETSDSDDIQNQYVIPVPAMREDEKRTVITYARPGTIEARVSVTLRPGPNADKVPQPKSPLLQNMLEPKDICYVTLGPRLPEMTRALTPPVQGNNRSPYRFASIDQVQQMPERWYGYAAADVVFLATGTKFIEELRDRTQSADRSNPGEALAEWVRRGGKLVITAGRNFQTVSEVLQRLNIIDCKIEGQAQVRTVSELSVWAGTPSEAIANLEVTKLKPGPGVTALIARRGEGTAPPQPLMVSAPCGLGRVIVLGFDVEGPPFTNWRGRDAFWKKLHEEIKPKVNQATNTNAQTFGGYQQNSTELGKPFQQSLESFEEVPVISFGWVALFIFIYILIVGPLDYFFLKKVVKRLELTWITFPAVVLIISVAAYFIAYRVKGNDLRINKTDVVDIDLEGNEVYGSTWFTLFSPRIQNYTVAVEPADDWAPVRPDPLVDYSPVVTTLSPPDNGTGGMNRSSSQSLFSRPYQYAPNAAAVQGVPIPVWASRSFTASWHTGLGPNKPLVADVQVNRTGDFLEGTLTSKLPAELTEVMVHYQGIWYKLGSAQTLTPNQPFRLDTLSIKARRGSGGDAQWLREDFSQFRRTPAAQQKSNTWKEPEPNYRVEQLMKSILFYSADGTKFNTLNNSNLRGLDQGWRLKEQTVVVGQSQERRFLNELILVGRVTAPSGNAEDVNKNPASASRLWLGRLPGDAAGRPPLEGKMSQDTYVRIYIPINSSDR